MSNTDATPDVTELPDEPVQAEVGELSAVFPLHDPFPPWEEIREVTRCTGHCCRAFSVGMSPAELGQKVIAARKAEAGGDDDDEGAAESVLCPEHIRWISEALVYLGEHEESPSGYNNDTLSPRERDEDPPGRTHRQCYWYACRHFVDDGCAIYDDRPPVCSDYPYRGKECHNSDCTRRTTMAAGLSWYRAHCSDLPDSPFLRAVLEDVGEDLDEHAEENTKMLEDST